MWVFWYYLPRAFGVRLLNESIDLLGLMTCWAIIELLFLVWILVYGCTSSWLSCFEWCDTWILLEFEWLLIADAGVVVPIVIDLFLVDDCVLLLYVDSDDCFNGGSWNSLVTHWVGNLFFFWDLFLLSASSCLWYNLSKMPSLCLRLSF